jgi:diguanylate cyclase (GGDEF)-like protein
MVRNGLSTDPSGVPFPPNWTLPLEEPGREGRISFPERDPLTGAMSRQAFAAAVERELATCGVLGEPLALVVLDLDDFRFVNDSFGHACGDALLESVAQTLRRAVRPGSLLARMSGDEFAICLPRAGGEEAQRVATALLARLRSHAARPTVSASAGVAVVEAGGSASELLVAADIALTEAKQTGCGGSSVYAGDRGDTLVWADRIRAAIDADRLVLHSQPIFDVASGAQVCEELLVRMLDEDGELLPPARFLPVAERFGLIEEIDRWVVDRGLELAAAGRPVSINLSARCVGDAHITRRVWEAVSGGVAPENILFELTETTVAGSMDDAVAFAQRLERIGCQLALDDFGTGFGSFLYLKSLPVAWIKIDMEFVRELATSRVAREVVRAVVGIARGLGQTTVAEGVEDDLTLRLLKELGVDHAQGYGLARPAPVEI